MVLVLFCLAVMSTDARSRRHPSCNEDQQTKMQQEFSICIEKFTNEHHENTGKVVSTDEYQKFTCKLLSDTVVCGDLWKRCHGEEDVRSMKDMHIAARMSQFADNKDGIDVTKCAVVREYIDSGRANRVDETTEGACTYAEITSSQTDFQDCSRELSMNTWNQIKELSEARSERETNDIEEEIEREDRDAQLGHAPETATLNPNTEIKPRLCSTLQDIAEKCTKLITKCFSHEDTTEMRKSHIDQMRDYYTKIYEGIDLKDCALEEYDYDDDYEYSESSHDNNNNRNEQEEYDEYDDNYEYDDYEAERRDFMSSSSSSSSSSSTTTTTTESSPPHRTAGSLTDNDGVTGYSRPEEDAVIAEPPSSATSLKLNLIILLASAFMAQLGM